MIGSVCTSANLESVEEVHVRYVQTSSLLEQTYEQLRDLLVILCGADSVEDTLARVLDILWDIEQRAEEKEREAEVTVNEKEKEKEKAEQKASDAKGEVKRRKSEL